MPPKKTKESDATAAEPRRSGRIASKPAPAVPEPQPKAPRATKKRAAEEEAVEEAEGSNIKKAKAQDESTMDEDQTPTTSTAALASIDIGDSLPSLTLKDEKGADLQIENLAKDQGVILFLVPKADTPGCTTQACGFRDSYPDFTSLNYSVYCLSTDTPSAQIKWQTKKELPYPLISDPKRILIAALGASEGGKIKRSHFIFEKGGKLVDRKVPVKPADSPQLALEFIKGKQ